jgi:hypothetical protein
MPTLVFPIIPINKKLKQVLTLGQVLSSGLYWIGGAWTCLALCGGALLEERLIAQGFLPYT